MILLGDARQMGLADNSIDAIVTDPPYGLEFMGKEWDKLEPARDRQRWAGKERKLIGNGSGKGGDFGARMGELPQYRPGRNWHCRKCSHYRFSGTPCQCDQPDWDNRMAEHAHKMQAWHHSWAIEALRVLKPGGHLLAMGGTRTFHRLTCALEDAGFEIRDTIMWLYGSGFPKSYNISKGFDRRAFKAWLDTVELDCCLVRGIRARKAQVRKAVSAAVGGAYAKLQDEKGVLDFQGNNTRPWKQSRGEGSRFLASLITRFWEPLNEIERHEIWQTIIGDHEGCDVGMPPGVRVGIGKYQPPNGMEWNLEQADNPDVVHSEPAFTASGVRTFGITAPSTPLARRFSGVGSAMKPAWEPVVVARKPLIGTLCENAEKWGTGGLAIDKCRVGHTPGNEGAWGAINRSDSRSTYGRKWQDEDGQTPCSSRNPQGRWPANLILSHSEDCVRVGTKRVRGGFRGFVEKQQLVGYHHTGELDIPAQKGYTDPDGYEQVEDWICVESCPVRLLDEQSGELKSGSGDKHGRKSSTFCASTNWQAYKGTSVGGDKGGASRFFKNIEPDKPLRFCYAAKSSRAERTCRGTIENKEPTVKPVNLCRYLERLVARPGVVILDPFCGSGSFGVAAILEGFNWIGIDNRLEACQIAKKRREWAIQQKGQPRLFK